jgi:hypothetical protein
MEEMGKIIKSCSQKHQRQKLQETFGRVWEENLKRILEK